MFEEVLRDSHPEVRHMLEAKAVWEKAVISRKDCEGRYEIAVSELESISQTELDSYRQVFQRIETNSIREALKSDPARHVGKISKLQAKVLGLQKIISIQKQVEAAEERKYRAAYKALFDATKPGFYSSDLLIAFASAGCVCAGHSVEVLNIEENETFEIEVKTRSEVPLVIALCGKKVGDTVSVTVQGQCTDYKVLNVRVTTNSSAL